MSRGSTLISRQIVQSLKYKTHTRYRSIDKSESKVSFCLFLDYSLLKSVDVQSYPSLVGLGKLSLLLQNETGSEVAMWIGDF